MARTAKILNPNKVGVIPDLDAGCSLADGCRAPAFQKWFAGSKTAGWWNSNPLVG